MIKFFYSFCVFKKKFRNELLATYRSTCMYFKEVFLTAKDQFILSESTFLKGLFFTYQSTYIIKFKYFPICQRALVQVLSIVRNLKQYVEF